MSEFAGSPASRGTYTQLLVASERDMPSSINENDVVPSSSETAARRDESPTRQQTVALEVPVSVNGARPADSNGKRETFAEATKTVLIHNKGAVIRLAASVAIGQLLFLTNDKSKKEVVCQVVKSKSYKNVSGYVELEFTEPAVGFWGMRFPNDHLASAPTTSPASATTVSAYDHVPTGVEPLALVPGGMDAPKLSTNHADTGKSAGVVSRPPKIEDFKTELRADDRSVSKADFLTPASEISTEALKRENSKLQDQLSSLLFSEQQTGPSVTQSSTRLPATSQALTETAPKPVEKVEAKPFAIEPVEPSVHSTSPAKTSPLSIKSTIEVEEVKIPAWLQPTALNTPAQEPKESAADNNIAPPARQAEKPEGWQALDAPSSRESHAPKATAPVFGKSLTSQADRQPRGSVQNSKIIWIATAAAIVLVTGGGVSWYLRQSPNRAPNSISAATLPIAAASTAPAPTIPVTSGIQPRAQSAPELEVPTASGSKTGSTPFSDASLSSPGQTKSQPAILSERIAKAPSNNGGAASTSLAVSEPSALEAEPQRPSIGTVRLAKPKLNRSAHSQPGSLSEPSIEISGDQSLPNDYSAGSGLVAETSKQPAAPPIPVGGDVVPARMISSVPPAYPALAKTQHIAGDVRIDALIEPNGRVSTMKFISGPSLLRQAALDSLRQWKYRPATLDGKPVPMHLTVTIQFRLQ